MEYITHVGDDTFQVMSDMIRVDWTGWLEDVAEMTEGSFSSDIGVVGERSRDLLHKFLTGCANSTTPKNFDKPTIS